ncbi:caspase family protein [Sphingomonas azotifigens]|uniref:caspase family protein n=1 Tax=Sphingomonas azotifigens TaxID=330920 RepID=UPI000A06A226|nr:caspase family protein [Sphingomonas azotifigens]
MAISGVIVDFHLAMERSMTFRLVLFSAFTALSLWFNVVFAEAQDLPDSPGDLFLPKPAGRVVAAAIATDGSVLFTAHPDHTVRAWDFAEGTSRTMLVHGESVQLRALGGRRAALILTSRGQVYSIHADRRRPLFELDGVHLIAVSPEGSYVAFAREDRVDVYRVLREGECLAFDHALAVPHATAVAIAAYGREIATSDPNHGLQQFRPGLEGAPLAPGGRFIDLAYDHSDRWLIGLRCDSAEILTASGRCRGTLVAIDRWGTGSSAESTHELRAASGARAISFDVRRRPSLDVETSPLVLATFEDGSVQLWEEPQSEEPQSSDDLQHGSFASRQILKSDAAGALFDPWDARAVSRGFFFSTNGTITLRRLDPSGVETTPLAQLLPIEQDGWAVLAPARFPGDTPRVDAHPHSLAEIDWALHQHLEKRTSYPLGAFAKRCETAGLLEQVRNALDDSSPSSACAPIPREPKIKLQLATPLPQTRGSRRYVAQLAIVGPLAANPGTNAPYLVHEGRYLPRPFHPVDCGGRKGTRTCWETDFTVVPGARNTVYAQIHDGKGEQRSERIEFDVPAASQPRRPVLHLITIGVSAYRGDPAQGSCEAQQFFCKLETPVQDLTRFRLKLQEVLAERSPLLLQMQPPIIDAAATRDSISSTLHRLSASVYPEDVVLIAISGHGYFDPYESPESADYYFPDVDAPRDFQPFLVGHRDSVMSMRWLVDEVAALEARTILFLVDACEAGGSAKAALAIFKQRLQRLGGPNSVGFLFSAKEGRSSFDGPAGGSTALMAAMLQVLEDSRQVPGIVTASDLFHKIDQILSERDRNVARSTISGLATGKDLAALAIRTPRTSNVGGDTLLLNPLSANSARGARAIR